MEIDQKELPTLNGGSEKLDDDDEDDNKLLIDTEESGGDAESVNEDELLKSDEDSNNHVPNGDVDQALATSQPNTVNIKKDDIQQSKELDKNTERSSDMELDSQEDGSEIRTGTVKTGEVDTKDDDKKEDTKLDENYDDSCTENEEESKLQRINLQFQRVENLKEELLKEEAALGLFRKLFDSQRGRNGFKNKLVVPPSNVSSKQTQPVLKQAQSLKPVAPAQNIQSKPSSQNSTQPAQKFYIQVGNQLVPAPPPVTNSYQYNGSNTSSNTSSSYQSQPQPQPKPSPPAPPKQTPEQKKNAAKAALRRQLEQTLLQIPPPRPPPADWNAIPNVNSIDFMMLVGLDEVVDTILSFDNKPTLKSALEELRPFNPRVCSQCKIDFSPCWKAAKNSCLDEYVLCENCSLQNVKKELKAEHTSRLKSAFMKALKQEQEIEEKIKAGEDVNVPGMENQDASPHSPKVSQSSRVASPKPTSQVTHSSSRSSGNHAPSPPERHHLSNGTHHHSSNSSSSRHQVVQHYPHHSLVQQLHHQHIQQQQIELEPSSRHPSRWHPYISSTSSHHREHHPTHHRSSYVQGSSSEGSPRQEYYVVHHPHHYVAR